MLLNFQKWHVNLFLGFYCASLQRVIKCPQCMAALRHSPADPCRERSLILMKNYFTDGRGLKYPSGSLCKLLFHAEKVIRNSKDVHNCKLALEMLLHRALLSLNFPVFEALQVCHNINSAYGADSHYVSLVHLVLRRYISLRLKKIHQDMSSQKNKGNYLHRSRIFQNV